MKKKELENEEWKIIQQYPDYEVSNTGKIRKIATKKVIKPLKASNGSLVCRVWYNKRMNSVYIHREMAKAFIPNPEKKAYVMHKNEDLSDNRLENLRWATKSDVSRKSYRTLLKRGKSLPRRKKSNLTDLTEREKEIMRRLQRGETGVALALEYNTSEMSISRINKKLLKLLQDESIDIQKLLAPTKKKK